MKCHYWKSFLFALAGPGLLLASGLPALAQYQNQPPQFRPPQNQPPQYRPPQFQPPQYQQPQYQPPHQHQPQGPQPSKAEVQKASIGGKYYDLLTVMYVPKDRNKHTDFSDWGYAKSMDYAGYKNVPAGYWVYNFPYWFIWGNMDPSRDFSLQEASVNGKYAKLLEKFVAEKDVHQVGKFHDAGFRKATSYHGHANLPAGYWVYKFPHWYIWGEQAGFGPKQNPQPFPNQPPQPPPYYPQYHQPQYPQFNQPNQPHGHSHDGRRNPYGLEIDVGDLIRRLLD